MISKKANKLLAFLFIILFCSCKKENAPRVIPDPTAETVTSQSSNYIVSTFAGSGTAGAADGDGPNAQFNWLNYTQHNPEIKWEQNCLALGPSGNLYVADAGNFAVRKITPSGMVTTIAGGHEGTSNGNGRNAQFSLIISVVADSAGNVYAAEQTRVRKISPSGDVTTLAGSLTPGFVDSTGTEARFNRILAMTLGKDGSVYVSDRSSIRRIAADGTVTTYIKDTPGGENFVSMIIDKSGNFYLIGLAILSYPSVVMITPSKVITRTKIGKFAPSALTINEQGEIYVVGFRDNFGPTYTNVYKMISPLEYIAICDNKPMGFANGPGNTAKFESVRGIAADALGNVFVGDYVNFRIRKIRKL